MNGENVLFVSSKHIKYIYISIHVKNYYNVFYLITPPSYNCILQIVKTVLYNKWLL